MTLNVLLVTITGAFLLVYSVEAADNPCSGSTGSTLSMKCDGCAGMIVCMGTTFVTKASCGAQFCNSIDGSAKCMDEAPMGCGTETTTTVRTTTTTSTTAPLPQVSTILCTGIGFYPDPHNCNRYHYCPAYGQESFDQVCPPGYAFHDELASTAFPCEQTVTPANCITIDCTTSNSIYTPYGSSSTYFAYCYVDSKTKLPNVSMFKCTEGARFDGTKCVFRCPREGLFTNTMALKTYYQCYFSGQSLVYRLMNCPNQKTFNEELQACT